MHHFKLNRKNFTKLTDQADSDEVPLTAQSVDPSNDAIEFDSDLPEASSSSSHPLFSVVNVAPTAKIAAKISAVERSSIPEEETFQRRGSAASAASAASAMGWNDLSETHLPEIPHDTIGGRTSSRQTYNSEANQIKNPSKRDLYLLLEDPSSSKAAFMTNVFVSVSIVSSAVMTTIETMPAFKSRESNALWCVCRWLSRARDFGLAWGMPRIPIAPVK